MGGEARTARAVHFAVNYNLSCPSGMYGRKGRRVVKGNEGLTDRQMQRVLNFPWESLVPLRIGRTESGTPWAQSVRGLIDQMSDPITPGSDQFATRNNEYLYIVGAGGTLRSCGDVVPVQHRR